MSISENIQKEQMREFRDRWQAVAEVEANEQRSATIKQRWKQLNAVLLMAKGLGLPIEESNEDDDIIYQRWAKLKGLLR